MKFDPIDINGKDIRVGDWVRVIAVPLSIRNMPDDSKAAFSKAVGNTLQIDDFNELGWIELDFSRKLGCSDIIWLEPFCVERFRRYKKPSKKFQKILELKKELELPKFVFSYKATWARDETYEEDLLHFKFDDTDIGQGWAVWHEERRIEGDISIYKHKSNSFERIKKSLQYVRSSKCFETLEVGEIELRESGKINAVAPDTGDTLTEL